MPCCTLLQPYEVIVFCVGFCVCTDIQLVDMLLEDIDAGYDELNTYISESVA